MAHNSSNTCDINGDFNRPPQSGTGDTCRRPPKPGEKPDSDQIHGGQEFPDGHDPLCDKPPGFTDDIDDAYDKDDIYSPFPEINDEINDSFGEDGSWHDPANPGGGMDDPDGFKGWGDNLNNKFGSVMEGFEKVFGGLEVIAFVGAFVGLFTGDASFTEFVLQVGVAVLLMVFPTIGTIFQILKAILGGLLALEQYMDEMDVYESAHIYNWDAGYQTATDIFWYKIAPQFNDILDIVYAGIGSQLIAMEVVIDNVSYQFINYYHTQEDAEEKITKIYEYNNEIKQQLWTTAQSGLTKVTSTTYDQLSHFFYNTLLVKMKEFVTSIDADQNTEAQTLRDETSRNTNLIPGAQAQIDKRYTEYQKFMESPIEYDPVKYYMPTISIFENHLLPPATPLEFRHTGSIVQLDVNQMKSGTISDTSGNAFPIIEQGDVTVASSPIDDLFTRPYLTVHASNSQNPTVETSSKVDTNTSLFFAMQDIQTTVDANASLNLGENLAFYDDVDFSIVGWFKVSMDSDFTNGNVAVLVSNTDWENTMESGWGLAVRQGDSQLDLLWKLNDGNTEILMTVADGVKKGVWTHIAIANDRSHEEKTTDIYINGKPMLTDQNTTELGSIDSAYPICIGVDGAGKQYVNSVTVQIDTFEMFGISLYAQEVISLIDEVVPTEGAAYSLRFQDDTMAEGQAYTSVTGDPTYQFGLNDYQAVTLSSSTSISINSPFVHFRDGDSFRISFWLNIPSSGSDTTIMTNQTTPGSSPGWRFYMTGTTLRFEAKGTGDFDPASVYASNVANGYWRYITLTYTTAEMSLYIDGKLQSDNNSNSESPLCDHSREVVCIGDLNNAAIQIGGVAGGRTFQCCNLDIYLNQSISGNENNEILQEFENGHVMDMFALVRADKMEFDKTYILEPKDYPMCNPTTDCGVSKINRGALYLNQDPYLGHKHYQVLKTAESEFRRKSGRNVRITNTDEFKVEMLLNSDIGSDGCKGYFWDGEGKGDKIDVALVNGDFNFKRRASADEPSFKIKRATDAWWVTIHKDSSDSDDPRNFLYATKDATNEAQASDWYVRRARHTPEKTDVLYCSMTDQMHIYRMTSEIKPFYMYPTFVETAFYMETLGDLSGWTIKFNGQTISSFTEINVHYIEVKYEEYPVLSEYTKKHILSIGHDEYGQITFSIDPGSPIIGMQRFPLTDDAAAELGALGDVDFIGD